jgi:hypothetical protein
VGHFESAACTARFNEHLALSVLADAKVNDPLSVPNVQKVNDALRVRP